MADEVCMLRVNILLSWINLKIYLTKLQRYICVNRSLRSLTIPKKLCCLERLYKYCKRKTVNDKILVVEVRKSYLSKYTVNCTLQYSSIKDRIFLVFQH